MTNYISELIASCQTEAIVPSQFTDVDGNLVTCGLDGVIRIWTDNGGLLQSFTAHDSPVRAVAKTGNFIVSGAKDGTLRVWDWGKKEMLFQFQDPKYTLWQFTATDKRLATAMKKGGIFYIQVWDLEEIEKYTPEQVSKLP